MSKYYEYERQLGRPLSERDKRFIDYGLAMGHVITVENGVIRSSSRLTPKQKEIVEEARRNGTIVSNSLCCFDSPFGKKEESSQSLQKLSISSFESVPFDASQTDEDLCPEVISRISKTTISKRSKVSRVKEFFGKVVSVLTGDVDTSDKSSVHSKKR